MLRSVLCNFLGTFTSRYSDYNGYWLFGFLTAELSDAEFNLLAAPQRSEHVLHEMHRLAAREFADQLAKSGLTTSRLASARLHVERALARETYVLPEGGGAMSPRSGWDFRFHAEATTVTGRRFACERTTFVAPHDPGAERRSWRPGKSPPVSGALDF